MWAADVTYAKQNGAAASVPGSAGWVIGAPQALPTDQAFWNWLLADAKQVPKDSSCEFRN